MEAVRCQGLRKRYGAVQALDGLSLTVHQGTVFGFLGPNGAGKTTTIRILTGLARPDDGSAWVCGAEVVNDAHQVAHRIGYLPEEPAFYGWMTPREFLDYVGQTFGMARAERQARTEELLHLVGLAAAADRRIAGFSRGMRQRLGLAQALVNRPEVLFLDEPASALDPSGRREVLQLIEGLRGQATVFMSTHILADVERVCDTVGIIARGRMVAEERREELLARYAVPAFELEAEETSLARMREWAGRLAQEPWVQTVSQDGPSVRVVVSDLQRAKRELLSSALSSGLVLTRYEMVRPSLEDVFLQLVGERAARHE